MTAVLRALGTAAASFRLTVACLLGLFVLTWLGTLHQVEHGLWAAQRAYFESWILWQQLGDTGFALPLPGGVLCMSVLSVNLLVGGMGRLLRSLVRGGRVVPRIGVLIVHGGIALLLLAGLVRFSRATEGALTLIEGQTARSYADFHAWEIAVARQESDDQVEEHLIPGEAFLDLAAGARATFTSLRLPFSVTVERSARHAHVQPAASGVGDGDGFVLEVRPTLAENERNIAGCVVAVRANSGVELGRAVLCGVDVAPWTVAAGDTRYALTLRKRTHPLPFALRLDSFVAEMHPGTNKPKAFRSEVTVLESERGARRVRVEMNEPLRVGDIVVYQSTWGRQGMRPDGPLFSGFQVVHNPADRWPLYGCVLVAAGMLLTFGWSLLRFLWRETAPAARATLLLLGAAVTAPAATAQAPVSARGFEAAAVDTFARLPLQDDGRIKPFETHASYLLLRLNGRRTLRLPEDGALGALAGTSLSATEWAMHVLFFPEQADRYPAFQVQTSEVIDAIELPHDGKRKRDRYSFAELRPGLSRLFALADRYGRIAEKNRSGVEQQVVSLAQNVADYDRLARSLDHARSVFADAEFGAARAQVASKGPLRFSDVAAAWPALERARAAAADDDADVEALVRRVRTLAADHGLLRLVPPADPRDAEWTTAAGVLAARSDPPTAPTLGIVRHFERLFDARADAAAFTRELALLDATLRAAMAARSEGARLDLEVTYLRADWFYRALLAFGLAFACVCVSWLRPRGRWLAHATWIGTGAGAALLLTGITMRCVLRSRPPISGLYETLLFVSAAVVLVALVVERFHRRRVFLSLAAALGLLGMFLAGRFETSEARDTMPTLQAVLDTNFWLATHVTIINLGYAGALLAGFIAHVYLLGGLLPRGRDPALTRVLARAVYGTLCFATLFTTVGTILGGIWANESWGRFWGWDPKENGALMIVLWNLLILHARLGGMVRDRGIAMLAVAGNMVVAFSWFHTNLLGVGLHSYGFASGLSVAVWTFYGVESAVLVAAWVGGRRRIAAA